jgi:hypothetical protein
VSFLWGCYYQILGPLLHLPKFANSLCRYSDTSVHLDSHLIWQATESYVERGSAFGFISHKGSLTARYRLLTVGNSLHLSGLPKYPSISCAKPRMSAMKLGTRQLAIDLTSDLTFSSPVLTAK